MATITKKDLIKLVATETNQQRAVVKRTIQCFLDHVIRELSQGHRLEFRDFGVFETRESPARVALNPKTLEQVPIPRRKTVRFKLGKLMQMAVDGEFEGRLEQHLQQLRSFDIDDESQEV